MFGHHSALVVNTELAGLTCQLLPSLSHTLDPIARGPAVRGGGGQPDHRGGPGRGRGARLRGVRQDAHRRLINHPIYALQ